MMGECNKQTAFEILDYFFENGGNFIDTYEALNQPRQPQFPPHLS